MAAAVAGALAFILMHLLLVILWGAGAETAFFPCIALAVGAAIAAASMKPVRAAAYGILAIVWLLLEGLVLVIACIAAALG
jgi:hypothetical protein